MPRQFVLPTPESLQPPPTLQGILVAVLSNSALDPLFVFNPVMGSSLKQQISSLRLCLWRSKSISVRKIIFDYMCMFFIQDTRINILT
ncbi:hypothetical protein CISIN_1g040381mg [Citrus sinensis]|uniref:Uncharacterized protein n=1 Tax=Citrus sinensis TaxID=2711 RepID=A0A067D124_CITSI|nr:hypothetical protein CISIN_1g040381mg [Citrus sinensis]